MEFNFERGDVSRPKGHALLYFRSSENQADVLASYLVVPPVPLNISKYMPPLFAGNLPPEQLQQVSAVPLPPLPEQVESYAHLQRLAELRDDDLVFGGVINPGDVQRSLMATAEAAQRYLHLYTEYLRLAPAPEPVQQELSDVSDVIYGLMTENQRLGELAKLTGKLRYALEGNDRRLADDTVREMQALARHVPEKYKVQELIAAAQIAGPRGDRLSQLYVDRCFRLSEEDYASLKRIEEEIQAVRGQGS